MKDISKILIADDNPDNVYLLERRLRRENYVFYTALDGQETLDKVEQIRPDLILLDVNMPKIDGFEVCRRLRQNEITHSIPIIIITAAKTSIQDQVTGLGLGADDYITKPFNSKELVVRVERKLQLKALEDELRRQQEEMTAILSSTAEAILRIGVDGMIQFFNQAAAHVFDVSSCSTRSNSLANKHYRAVLVEYPAFINAFEQTKEKASHGPANFEVALPDKRVFSVNIAPVTDSSRQFDGWVLVLRDITHFKEIDRLKSTVIANAAHDLKNPLSSAILYLEMLVDTLSNPNETQYIMATNALQSIERIKQIATHLLDLERLETGNILDLQTCDLVAIVTDLTAQMTGIAQQQGIQLEAEIADTDVKVEGDFIYLSRAISNLIHNALKFTPSGGSVTIGLRVEDQGVILSVRDTGPGIPSEHQAHIFERFYRIKDQKNSGDLSGSGLGLAIVKSVIDQHNGFVWVKSQRGKGTTFYISLPCFITAPPNLDEPLHH